LWNLSQSHQSQMPDMTFVLYIERWGADTVHKKYEKYKHVQQDKRERPNKKRQWCCSHNKSWAAAA